MAWLYLCTCAFDFIIAPVFYAILQNNSDKLIQWSPLTLKGNGLYHMAMLTVLGITAWGRSQEKLKMMEINNGFGGFGESEVEVEKQTETVSSTEEPKRRRP